jgi:hypothetical protein
MPINKQQFLKTIKQGVKDVGTVYNPVTAFNTVKQNVKRKIEKDKATFVDRSTDTQARKKFYEENKQEIDRINRLNKR